jgi:trigger factor
LKTEILSQERNVVEVKAEYDVDEVNRAVNKTVRDLSDKVSIKGFRKGHVPRKTLELYFGRDKIYMDTAERIMHEALDGIVSEYDLDLIATPMLSMGQLTEGEPLSMQFTFEVRPEVILPDLSTIAAEKTMFKVEDRQVEDGLKQFMESNAELVPIDEDRAATADDIVETQYTSYSLKKDGSAKEIEKDKKNILLLSGIRMDIAEAVIGKKPAEEFSFEIKLEDDYPDGRLAGTVVRYDMEILQFMKRVVPEATDEKIEQISNGKLKTVDEFKQELRKQMEEVARKRSEASLNESAVMALAEASEVDVPESMINHQYELMRKNDDNGTKRDLNQSLDEYLSKNNLSVDEYESKLKKRAERTVRNSLVINALADKEEISFTSNDINDEIMRMANAMKVNPQQLADVLSKNKEEFVDLTSRVRIRNTIDFLVSKVIVKEVAPDEMNGGKDDGHAEQTKPEDERCDESKN